jgi:hypothetical protein
MPNSEAPLLRRPRRPLLDDGSRVICFPEPKQMSSRSASASAPVVRHPYGRGVHSQPIGSGRIYFNVTSDGVQGVWRIPIGQETEDDVIEALADDLDVRDPLPRFAAARGARRPASRAGAPVRHLHRV